MWEGEGGGAAIGGVLREQDEVGIAKGVDLAAEAMGGVLHELVRDAGVVGARGRGFEAREAQGHGEFAVWEAQGALDRVHERAFGIGVGVRAFVPEAGRGEAERGQVGRGRAGSGQTGGAGLDGGKAHAVRRRPRGETVVRRDGRDLMRGWKRAWFIFQDFLATMADDG